MLSDYLVAFPCCLRGRVYGGGIRRCNAARKSASAWHSRLSRRGDPNAADCHSAVWESGWQSAGHSASGPLGSLPRCSRLEPAIPRLCFGCGGAGRCRLAGSWLPALQAAASTGIDTENGIGLKSVLKGKKKRAVLCSPLFLIYSSPLLIRHYVNLRPPGRL